MYENGLFIFRRDLRLIDNIGLNTINKKCKNVYTIFIFTPEQITSKNKFKSDNCVQFMIESLKELKDDINDQGGKLMFFYGSNNKVIKSLIDELEIDYICYNKDYTPYALQRDESIRNMCDRKNVYVEETDDYYLYSPGTILNGSGNIYQKFTPFYREAIKYKVNKPSTYMSYKFLKTNKKLSNTILLEKNNFYVKNDNILLRGGRTNGLEKLKKSKKNVAEYDDTRNIMALPTSELSAYLKFGCISVREVYDKHRNNNNFIRQLYWRDFYGNVLYAYPHSIGSAMNEKYNAIKWCENEEWFRRWCDGETGYPVVDAAMRQLNETGYMHNRGRLIVGSFLVKTLGISWQWGERYFSTKLIDYDPAMNNGNWNWVAGSGTDSQPWFRIFNPWEQTKKFDGELLYIKKWLPELKDIDNKIILNWQKEQSDDIRYPRPMVDYSEQKIVVLKMYKKALQS